MIEHAVAPIHLAHESPFALGRLEVSPATREVRSAAFQDTLEPRVMQVLVALAKERGTVISRDDLVLSCWEGRVVGEDAINRVIARLRRLSERDEGRSFTLETITKVGYRLKETPSPAEATIKAAPAAAPARAASGFPRRWLYLAAVALLGIVAGLVVYFTMPGGGSDVPAHLRPDFDQAGQAMERSSAEDSARAISLLQSVVERAPDSADAWARLALAYLQSLEFTRPEQQDGVAERARSAARRALEITPRHPVAEFALIALTPEIQSWAELERKLDAVLAESPEAESFRGMRAGFYVSTGRLRLGIQEQEAIAKFSSARSQGTYAQNLVNAGRLEDADRVLAAAARNWPRNRSIYFTRFWVSIFTGRPQDAVALISDVNARPTGISSEDFPLYRATAEAFVTREPGMVAHALREGRAAARRGRGYAQNAMRTASALGDLDMAFALAEGIFFNRGEPIGPLMFSEAQGQYASRHSRPVYILYDLALRPMRHDMRFVALAEELGLGAYWRESGNWPDFCADDKDAAAVCETLRSGG